MVEQQFILLRGREIKGIRENRYLFEKWWL